MTLYRREGGDLSGLKEKWGVVPPRPRIDTGVKGIDWVDKRWRSYREQSVVDEWVDSVMCAISAGHSVVDIARDSGMSRQMVYYRLKEEGK